MILLSSVISLPLLKFVCTSKRDVQPLSGQAPHTMSGGGGERGLQKQGPCPTSSPLQTPLIPDKQEVLSPLHHVGRWAPTPPHLLGCKLLWHCKLCYTMLPGERRERSLETPAAVTARAIRGMVDRRAQRPQINLLQAAYGP